MARSLAAEWSTSTTNPIRVNTLSPGYTQANTTDQLLDQLPGLKSQWEHGTIKGRLAEPHEFRAPVVFLLADGSSFMTGADLRVDGGYRAW